MSIFLRCLKNKYGKIFQTELFAIILQDIINYQLVHHLKFIYKRNPRESKSIHSKRTIFCSFPNSHFILPLPLLQYIFYCFTNRQLDSKLQQKARREQKFYWLKPVFRSTIPRYFAGPSNQGLARRFQTTRRTFRNTRNIVDGKEA